MVSDIAGPITRLINATRYSLRGLRDAWRTQAPFRYECYVLILVIPLGWRYGETAAERSLLIGSWLIVLIVELINSAIENIVDRIGIEYHDLSGRAKDLGSAAVFCSIVLFATIWVIIWLR
jgi:diacylglycerol kinase (ATP)